jgi:hypothetical protein
MTNEIPPDLAAGVALKANAVLGVVRGGQFSVAAIAEATSLPVTTVLRVAALLRDRGLLLAGVEHGDIWCRPRGFGSAATVHD